MLKLASQCNAHGYTKTKPQWFPLLGGRDKTVFLMTWGKAKDFNCTTHSQLVLVFQQECNPKIKSVFTSLVHLPISIPDICARQYFEVFSVAFYQSTVQPHPPPLQCMGVGTTKKTTPQKPAAISDTPFIFCRIQNHLPHLLPGKQLSFILKSCMLKARSGDFSPADDREHD